MSRRSKASAFSLDRRSLGEQHLERALQAPQLLLDDPDPTLLPLAFGRAVGHAAVDRPPEQLEIEHHGIDRRLEIVRDAHVDPHQPPQLGRQSQIGLHRSQNVLIAQLHEDPRVLRIILDALCPTADAAGVSIVIEVDL